MSHSSQKMEARIITRRNKLPKSHLVASVSKGFTHKTIKCINSMKQGIQSSGTTGDVVIFLVSTAALEIVRRFSKASCPFIWRGLQMLQVLCYPPFKWLQKWALFKPLVKHVQKLSRPMLVLSIATVFSDQSECKPEASDRFSDSQPHSESQLDPSANFPGPDIRSHDEIAETHASEEWLMQLQNELNKQSITLPERFDEVELGLLYAAVNGDFSRLLSSVKRTIDWRKTFTIFSTEELEDWSHLVFWHGCDAELRHCLIIRLGLACSTLRSKERPLFVKAVVSQIEHGIVNLVDLEHPQITVLMDCEGISPLGFPVQMMRSCSLLLQDHYPNRLGCLIIVRLAQVARVVTQTLFQVLQPATRQKLRIIGGNHQEFLSQFLQSPPSFLGGGCTCTKCSDPGALQIAEEKVNRNRRRDDLATKDTGGDAHLNANTRLNQNKEQLVRIVIIGLLVLCVLVALALGTCYPEKLPHLDWQYIL